MRELRHGALEAASGEVAVPARVLVERLAPPPPDHAADDGEARRDRRRFAASLLAQHGLRADPPLAEADADGGPVRLRATNEFAVQGALLLGAVASVVGYLAFWAYGLALAVATVAAVALVARRFGLVDRVVPRAVPRGRTTGVLVAAVALGVAVAFVVLPVRSARVDDSRVASAAGLAQAADAALRGGNLDEAERLLGEAAAVDPRTPTLEAVRSRVIAARVVELLERQDRP